MPECDFACIDFDFFKQNFFVNRKSVTYGFIMETSADMEIGYKITFYL